MSCPACGAAAPEGARFCPSCGFELSSRGDERRVVTVLFGDLVGFTGMAETLDPEQVKLIVERCFELLVSDITSFGGRVDKIVGDAIVALFGAPVAHEDDPERAVRAALRMQKTLATNAAGLGAPVQMRIGVNTGEVLVGSLRAGGDYTAMGDVVNTASRLQTMAEPGQVVVGGATHAATAEVIAYRPIGAIAVRGRGDPVEAWVAVEALVPPGHRRRRTRTPLVGRDSELGLIGHALDAAVQRRRAVAITLIGEAGVGKSRLAREVAALAAQEGDALVLEGRCLPYGEANLWWPVAEAIRAACGVSGQDGPAEIRQKVVESVAGALDRTSEDPEVVRLGFGLLHLMGLESPLRGIEPQRAREELTRSVLGFLEAHLRQRPVMLLLADLHWAPEPVLELLGSLLERLVEEPFVLLSTARPPFRDSWAPAGSRHNTLVVNVDPLGREATGALLDALLDERIDPELRTTLLDRSGGNPLFLEELVALLDATGVVPDATGPGASLVEQLPGTLRGLVAARLDGLTTVERRVLEDAAVFGRTGPLEALVLMAEADRAGVGPRNQIQVEEAVEGLAEKEILVLDQQANTYAFRTGLVRDVAYNTLTKSARAQRHYGIGEYLERHFLDEGEPEAAVTDMLAHHYGQAAELVRDLGAVPGIPDDLAERALIWLSAAARRAEAGEAHALAEPLFGRALALLGEEPSGARVEMLLGRAKARAELRRLDAARADVELALDLSEEIEDRAGQARALMIEGSILEKEGELDEAVVTLQRAEEWFRQAGDRQGMAEALRLRGMAELFRGDPEAARAAISGALDAFGALGDRRGQAWALQNLAWIAYLEGRPTEADRRIQQSAEMFSEIGDGGGLGWALGLLAWVRFFQGELEVAEELGESILPEARERGDRWAEGMMQLLLASVRLWSGKASQAVTLAQEAVELFKAVGDLDREAQAASVLGRALIALGMVGEGFRTIDLAIEHGRGLDRGVNVQEATVAAAAAVAVGDPERALRAVALLGVETLDPSVVGENDRLVALGLALLQMGQLDEALAHLQSALVTEGEELSSCYALSAMACAEAVAGRVDEVERLSSEVLEAPRATYADRITALVALGALREGLGDHASAAAAFSEATELADSSDDKVVQLLVRLARSEMAELCGHPLPELAAEVEARRAELGVDAAGWLRWVRDVHQRSGLEVSLG